MISVEEFLDHRRDKLFQTSRHETATESLIDLYRSKGLLPGSRDEALHVCCPNRESCWAGVPLPSNDADPGITFPWIGADYFDHGVVLLGVNFHNGGGLEGNYWVCDTHIEEMRKGKPGKAGLPFARGAMLYGRAVLAHLAGNDLSADEKNASNEELAPLWEKCAFLEKIKCSPGSERSEPSEAMQWNCPPFLARHELEILGPRVILNLGRGKLRREWLVKEDDYGEEQGPHLERDTATIDGKAVPLITLNHPSSRVEYVNQSLKQLVDSLERKPLAVSA